MKLRPYLQNQRPTFGFMGFLDVLFSAIGVFLILLFLQQLLLELQRNKPTENLQPQAEVLIICEADNHYTWVTLQQEPLALTSITSLKQKLLDQAKANAGHLRVLGAFSSEAIAAQQALKAVFNKNHPMLLEIAWLPFLENEREALLQTFIQEP